MHCGTYWYTAQIEIFSLVFVENTSGVCWRWNHDFTKEPQYTLFLLRIFSRQNEEVIL